MDEKFIFSLHFETDPYYTRSYNKEKYGNLSDLLEGQLSPEEERKIRIEMLWKQLDCIRRVPTGKMVGRKYVLFPPSRSRVIQKRPIPAVKGKYAIRWYEKRVTKLMITLFGSDISKGNGDSYIDSLIPAQDLFDPDGTIKDRAGQSVCWIIHNSINFIVYILHYKYTTHLKKTHLKKIKFFNLQEKEAVRS